jgi:glutaminyl-peptide cyclotransferase
LRRSLSILFLGLLLLGPTGCGNNTSETARAASPTNASTAQAVSPSANTNVSGSAVPDTPQAASGRTPLYTYEVVHAWPHERDAFTQGLVFLDGQLLESTGLYGRSSLRRVELESGKVLKRVEVPAEYFAEGLAVLGGKAYQLTWQNGKGFVYDLDSFRLEREFYYSGEGWGLATDGQSLILSDGTDQIRFLDPMVFAVQRTIRVADHGHPVKELNELEYIKGEIFANIWRTQYVVRIDPKTGNVVGAIDFGGLLASGEYTSTTDVLNGIAYDPVKDRLFVTGKCWPKLFEVRLKLKE